MLLPILTALSLSIPILNFENSEHLVSLQIGSPPQTLELLLDTGSSSFWVPSSLCMSLSCRFHTKFDHLASETFRPEDVEFEVVYRSGVIIGEIGFESVHFGNVTVPDLLLGLVFKEQGDAFRSLPFSGILGLGFGTEDCPSLFDSLVSLQVLKKNIAGVFLSQKTDQAGELLFGEVNQTLVASDFVYAEVVSESFWDIEIEEVAVAGKVTSLCKDLREMRGKCVAAIDTGTPVLAGPADFVWEVLNALKVKSDCSNVKSLPSLEVFIAGRRLSLEPEDYLVVEDGECTVALMSMDVSPPRGPLFVLGSTFLRKYYTVLDRDFRKVGFALAKRS